MIKTLHIRVKNSSTKHFIKWASEVNFVWNFINELSSKFWKQQRKWLNAYDVHPFTSGATKEDLTIGAATVQAINEEHATRRRQFKRSKLRWRNSKKLGWVPFKLGQVKFKDGMIRFNKRSFKIWDSYGLEKYTLRAGNFSQDVKGNWYLNVAVEFKPVQFKGTKDIGIDLGLKELATYSDGTKFTGDKWYRNQEEKLAAVQRANKKNRVRAIYTKIKNCRKDALHKESSKLVKDCKNIAVGNVNSSSLAKTKMAKSVLDAGWGMFKTMLEYKSRWASVGFEIVNEAYSTQTCSDCGCISGPKGPEGLGIRIWRCEDCNCEHDRDINAAKNILSFSTFGLGHKPLVVGIPSFYSGENVKPGLFA